MEELAHFYHPEDAPQDPVSPQHQHQVNFLGEAEPNISYQGTIISTTSSPSPSCPSSISFTEPTLQSQDLLPFLSPSDVPPGPSTFSLRLVRLSRTFGPGQKTPQLRIPHSLFSSIFAAIEADPTIKYLVQSDYDGFHHRQRQRQHGARGRISTFYLGSSVSSLLWTFDHSRLLTRGVQISRGRDGAGLLNAATGARRTNHEEDFKRALWAFRRYAGSPHCLAVASCVAAGKAFDEKTDYDLKAVRKVEGTVGYGPFKRSRAEEEEGEKGEEGKGGDDMRRRYGVIEMDEMTESIQLVGAASAGAANRRRNILILDEVLEFIARDKDNEYPGGSGEGDGEGGGDNHFRIGQKALGEVVPVLKQQNGCLREYLKYLKDRSDRISTLLLALLTHADAVSNLELAEACKRDSSSMKTVAIMTMAFLPGTFFSALWAMPSLNWTDPRESVVQNGFWLYWVCSISLTLLTFAIWYGVTERKRIAGGLARAVAGNWRTEGGMGMDLEMKLGVDEKLFGRT